MHPEVKTISIWSMRQNIHQPNWGKLPKGTTLPQYEKTLLHQIFQIYLQIYVGTGVNNENYHSPTQMFKAIFFESVSPKKTEKHTTFQKRFPRKRANSTKEFRLNNSWLADSSNPKVCLLGLKKKQDETVKPWKFFRPNKEWSLR